MPSSDHFGPQCESYYFCDSCKRRLSENFKLGSKCPGCGVTIYYTENPDGTYRDAKGRKVNPWLMGGGAGALGLVIGILCALFRAFRSK